MDHTENQTPKCNETNKDQVFSITL